MSGAAVKPNKWRTQRLFVGSRVDHMHIRENHDGPSRVIKKKVSPRGEHHSHDTIFRFTSLSNEQDSFQFEFSAALFFKVFLAF